MSDTNYWLAFNLVSGIGPAKTQALLGYFNTLEMAWSATGEQLAALGFDQRTIENFEETRSDLDVTAYAASVASSGTSVLTLADDAYPSLLREIPAAPPLIFVRGQFEPVDNWAVAVVGTRRLSAYGKVVARDLAGTLAANGITIVSGLARGIDAIAHRAALENGGRTIAVLATGVDVVYPPEHRDLVGEILDGRGAIVSEYPLGTAPDGRNFPARNRLISGLSLGTLVIEAGERSGALITARFALEQDREVFSVPGNINSPASAGTNRLIQQGAKLVGGVEDIMEELNLRMIAEKAEVVTIVPDSAEEAALLSHLSSQPVHVDELSRTTGFPSGMVSSTLTMMELKGMVQQVSGMQYVRLHEPGPEYNVGVSQEGD